MSPAAEETDAGIRVSMFIDTKVEAEFLFARDNPPYNLRIGLQADPKTNLKSASVHKVVIEYENGEKNELSAGDLNKAWRFETQQSSNWVDNGLVYHQSLWAVLTFTNCIDKPLPFTVKFEGRVADGLGQESTFSVRSHFSPVKLRGPIPRPI
jgi:hypothetical protein